MSYNILITAPNGEELDAVLAALIASDAGGVTLDSIEIRVSR